MPVTNKILAEQYGKMHEMGYFPGQQVKYYKGNIADLVVGTNAKTLLDYGCGKGSCYEGNEPAYKAWGGIVPFLYDPYYPPHAARPDRKFDGVICTDVMEHVPEADIDDVLRDIAALANKFVFITICTRPAKKLLPDGRNAHVTVKPEEWWKEKLAKIRTNGLIIEYIFTE